MTPRERIAAARLYLVCEARPRAFLEAALRGGVDMIQLRDKHASDGELIRAAADFRAAADAHGALFVLNDRPDLVEACAADGVHLGQDDGEPAAARAVIGPDRVIGRSTHAPIQGAEADGADADVDYLAVGPVHATPTKPGRPAAGLEYVAWAAFHVDKPWFAIGGLDAGTVPEVVRHGATRIVVVRAITEAEDPAVAARALRAALDVPAADTPQDRMRRGYSRSAARNEAVRRTLVPLAPGERPRAVTVAALLAGVIGVSNLVLLAAGYEVSGQDPSVPGAILFAGLMLAAAIGMWKVRYWAVLGFEALLGIGIAFAFLSLLVASNLAAVALCLAIIAIAGPLFWLLVKAMARIQMPERRPREPVG